MLTWIQVHALTLVAFLTSVIVVTPIVGNLAIRVARAVSKQKNDRADRIANYLVAKVPLVIGAAVFARDVIVHPERLEAILDATQAVRTVAATSSDPDVVVASARLTAAVRPVAPIDPLPAPPSLIVGALMAFVLFAAGCTGAQMNDAKSAVQDISLGVSVLDPALHTVYEDQQERCAGGGACIARVRAQWAPIIDALQAVRAAWCRLDATAKGCAP